MYLDQLFVQSAFQTAREVDSDWMETQKQGVLCLHEASVSSLIAWCNYCHELYKYYLMLQ